MIYFSQPSISTKEEQYIIDALHNSKLSGDGKYTMKVYEQMKSLFGIEKMLLTTSGTTALEMAAILIDLQAGDEILVPSFTFSSTVNAFLLRGALPIFCDIRSDTFNIDESKLEERITPKTRAIYCVHYAGIPCDMDIMNDIARKHNLYVIEDAAQAVGSTYKGHFAGMLSEFGCYSFHETKNYVMGEGGAIVINEQRYLERAEIIREKGTNRKQFLDGVVDKYTWHDIGSSFLPSDLLAALLSAQLERYQEIMTSRLNTWNQYHVELKDLEDSEKIVRSKVPNDVTHNGHMYNIVLPNLSTRSMVIDKLRSRGIVTAFCYVPLHSSPMGSKLGYKANDCPVTEDYASRILRLPLHAHMTDDDVSMVVKELTVALS